MKASVDLSLYPLSQEYVPAIIDFIHRLQANPDIEIVRNALSTQLFGELPRILQIIGEELERSWTEHGRAVLVAKFVCGDVRSGG